MIRIEERAHLLGMPRGGGRANRLVRFLCVLGFRRVAPRFLGQVLGAEAFRDDAADLDERLVRERHRVGAHVADQTDGALADVDAFVEALRHRHRALRAEAELARRLLLQRRGRERRRRIAAALLLVDLRDGQRAARRVADSLFGRADAGFVRERELLDLLAAEDGEPSRERLARLLGKRFDRPVFLGLECGDLLLALDDEPQRGALHAPRGQAAAHLFPEQRRQVEADEIVEGSARLLRVDELLRQIARLIDRFLNRALRDLVEHDALHGLRVDDLAFLEHLVNVPGNRLAFAIGVGCEIHGRSLLRRLHDLVDVLFVLLDELILHREAALRIDGAFLRHQVAHVAVRRKHLEIAAEVFLDSARLGRRFNDDEILGHNGVAMAYGSLRYGGMAFERASLDCAGASFGGPAG